MLMSLATFKALFQCDAFCSKSIFLILTIGFIRDCKFYIASIDSRIQIVRSKIISILDR